MQVKLYVFMKKIVIFASGSGSNAEKIMHYFENHSSATVAAVLTNKAEAGVLSIAKNFQVPTMVFSREDLNGAVVVDYLKELQPDLIVLAGFLLKFPKSIIEEFPGKIVNIHPALLPAYGGKGMYGINVHRAVVENRAAETGITIHYIDEFYDEGATIFQEKVFLNGDETAEEVAAKVLKLEHTHFAQVINQILNK